MREPERGQRRQRCECAVRRQRNTQSEGWKGRRQRTQRARTAQLGTDTAIDITASRPDAEKRAKKDFGCFRGLFVCFVFHCFFWGGDAMRHPHWLRHLTMHGHVRCSAGASSLLGCWLRQSQWPARQPSLPDNRHAPCLSSRSHVRDGLHRCSLQRSRAGASSDHAPTRHADLSATVQSDAAPTRIANRAESSGTDCSAPLTLGRRHDFAVEHVAVALGSSVHCIVLLGCSAQSPSCSTLNSAHSIGWPFH